MKVQTKKTSFNVQIHLATVITSLKRFIFKFLLVSLHSNLNASLNHLLIVFEDATVEGEGLGWREAARATFTHMRISRLAVWCVRLHVWIMNALRILNMFAFSPFSLHRRSLRVV